VPWSLLNLWKWVPGISPGVKAAGAFGWRPTTLVVPKVEKMLGLNLHGTPWATSACRGITLLLLYFTLLNNVHCSFWKDAELNEKQFSRKWSIYVCDATCRPGSDTVWVHGSCLQMCGWISWEAPSRCLYQHWTTQTQTSLLPEAFERRNSTVRVLETTAIVNDTGGSNVAF
jgi:hypothetical protein